MTLIARYKSDEKNFPMGCVTSRTSGNSIKLSPVEIEGHQPSQLVQRLVACTKHPSRECAVLHTVLGPQGEPEMQWSQSYIFGCVTVTASVPFPLTKKQVVDRIDIEFFGKTTNRETATALCLHVELQLCDELSKQKPPWEQGITSSDTKLCFTRRLNNNS